MSDERDPTPCQKCGETCTYDGWGLVHSNGIGIGSCDYVTECNGLCVMAYELIERAPNVVAYAHRECDLHNPGWWEHRD